jgi:hypothetical protein
MIEAAHPLLHPEPLTGFNAAIQLAPLMLHCNILYPTISYAEIGKLFLRSAMARAAAQAYEPP